MRLGILAAVAVLGLFMGPAVARAADETTQYRVNPQHSNSVPDSPLQPPLRLRWQANLGQLASNVVVAGGRVFYVRHPGTDPEITALRASDGAMLWSRTWMAKTWGLNGLAFDGGRLFWVRNHSEHYPYDVHVEAIDPATGATIWNRNIPSGYGAGSHPTVANGELYLLGNASSSMLHALRQSDGADRWPAKSLSSGDNSTPSLDGSNVYVSLAGAQTYAFDRTTGAERWHYGGCCTGGGGTTTMVFGGRLFAQDGLIHDTSNGLVVGSWSGRGLPSWSGDSGVAHLFNKLRGFGPSYEATRWEFGIDEYTSLSLPFVAGAYAYTSTTDWSPHELMALRLGDGARVWCQPITEQPPGTQSNSAPYPVAAGHGLLFVSSGYGLAAFESGGPPSDCNTAPVTPSGSPAPAGPALRLTAGRRALRLGQRTKVVGRLSGLPNSSGQTIAVDLDEWPLDGKFKRAARGKTASDGTFAFKYVPRRNAQLRARLIGEPRLVSQPVVVYADFPITVRKRDAGGRGCASGSTPPGERRFGGAPSTATWRAAPSRGGAWRAAAGSPASARPASRCATRGAGCGPATDGSCAPASESPTPLAARGGSTRCAAGARCRADTEVCLSKDARAVVLPGRAGTRPAALDLDDVPIVVEGHVAAGGEELVDLGAGALNARLHAWNR
jgi:outer membrane protein assembly factor BamB